MRAWWKFTAALAATAIERYITQQLPSRLSEAQAMSPGRAKGQANGAHPSVARETAEDIV